MLENQWKKNKQVNQDITNKILEKRKAASKLQAAVKREDVQHIYNIGVENPRAANKITAAIKRKNLKSMKESITNLKDVYVIPKFKHELDTRAVTPLEQAALVDNSALKTIQSASATAKLETAFKRTLAQGKLRASENATKRIQAAVRRNDARSNYHELDKRGIIPKTDVEAEFAKLGIRKHANITLAGSHELDKRGVTPLLQARNSDSVMRTIKKAAAKSNVNKLSQSLLSSNRQQFRQAITDRPNLENRSAISNLGQLTKAAQTKSNRDAVKPRQVVLRSGLVTGSPRLAAFRETHPQTIALQNKISDLKRGKGTGDLKQLQEQLQAAKKDEGVGQAKRGRPAGSKNVKK